MAGKVDVCLFDKTGTLTTDELVAVGVEPSKVSSPSSGPAGAGVGKAGGLEKAESDYGSATDTLVPMTEAPASATLVLGGCQSLVLVDDSPAGDPVEAAAMKAIKVRQGPRFVQEIAVAMLNVSSLWWEAVSAHLAMMAMILYIASSSTAPAISISPSNPRSADHGSVRGFVKFSFFCTRMRSRCPQSLFVLEQSRFLTVA